MRFRIEFEFDAETRDLADQAADAADSTLMELLGSEYVSAGPVEEVVIDEYDA